ncbi:hypothetical protein OSB04_019518 [Centaurea solstitialis]|uniref:GDSL esterase/lipase n=1 Tax=Centaurea solstitialis TaxID=347529 RepID=A0AA38SQH3_9ASTR|nr:hypothetical protein OSB04_019518 [Centaurea solstitialis]
MGEIGGNDYNHALMAGKSIDDLETYVPLVIKTIVSAINVRTKIALEIFFRRHRTRSENSSCSWNLPIGCSPLYLTMYYGLNDEEYDNTTGCLIRLNKFAEHHNELLQRELNHIRECYPDVNIMYGDYYNAAMQFYWYPDKFGFVHGALKACCGGGGPFNYNTSATCGSPSSTTCAQPNVYANWDGLHLTEAAYKLIYEGLFEGSYTIPPFNSSCRTTLRRRGGSSQFA